MDGRKKPGDDAAFKLYMISPGCSASKPTASDAQKEGSGPAVEPCQDVGFFEQMRAEQPRSGIGICGQMAIYGAPPQIVPSVAP